MTPSNVVKIPFELRLLNDGCLVSMSLLLDEVCFECAVPVRYAEETVILGAFRRLFRQELYLDSNS